MHLASATSKHVCSLMVFEDHKFESKSCLGDRYGLAYRFLRKVFANDRSRSQFVISGNSHVAFKFSKSGQEIRILVDIENTPPSSIKITETDCPIQLHSFCVRLSQNIFAFAISKFQMSFSENNCDLFTSKKTIKSVFEELILYIPEMLARCIFKFLIK